MKNVITAILGGGAGSRLWPLTAHRAKPAVPVAGKFRLIDVPISNSLHAEIEQIYVLTQFNSASLHRHIAQTYRFDLFSKGFVNILAAEQNLSNTEWYQGTADAVRQNLDRLTHGDPRDVLVLSGDQLYAMRMANFVQAHRDTDADLTIAVKPVPRDQASEPRHHAPRPKGRIVEFVEKPKDRQVLDRLTLDKATIDEARSRRRAGHAAGLHGHLRLPLGAAARRTADRRVADRLRQGDHPSPIGKMKVYRLPLQRLLARHRNHSGLPRGQSRTHPSRPAAQPLPPRLPHLHPPALSAGRQDPRLQGEQSVLCEGSILRGAEIERSVIGIRSMVRRARCSRMCGDGHQLPTRSANDVDPVPFGIGRELPHPRAPSSTRGARVGDGCRCSTTERRGVDDPDGTYFIRGGIIVVPAQATVQPGTVI